MLALLGMLIMAVSLLLVPLGVPGTWIMVAVMAAAAWLGDVGILVVAVCFGLALFAEIAEYVITERLNLRYGGSRRAFWGAIFGGIAGMMVGLPVPIVGPILAGLLGSFAGAAVATFYETRQIDRTMRVGWGVLLGRIWAAVAKVAAGLAIFVIGSTALLL